jgi:hypothetical protein
MVCYSNPILSPKTDFSPIFQNLFMQNEPNGMLLPNPILFLKNLTYRPKINDTKKTGKNKTKPFSIFQSQKLAKTAIMA